MPLSWRSRSWTITSTLPCTFFLGMLASSETVYTLVIVPRILSRLIFHNLPISSAGCATQMFFFVTLATNSCFLLIAMGYNCYVAICDPLRYMVIMSKGMCAWLVCGSLGTGLIMAVLHVPAMFSLPFCGTVVEHFLWHISSNEIFLCWYHSQWDHQLQCKFICDSCAYRADIYLLYPHHPFHP